MGHVVPRLWPSCVLLGKTRAEETPIFEFFFPPLSQYSDSVCCQNSSCVRFEFLISMAFEFCSVCSGMKWGKPAKQSSSCKRRHADFCSKSP